MTRRSLEAGSQGTQRSYIDVTRTPYTAEFLVLRDASGTEYVFHVFDGTPREGRVAAVTVPMGGNTLL